MQYSAPRDRQAGQCCVHPAVLGGAAGIQPAQVVVPAGEELSAHRRRKQSLGTFQMLSGYDDKKEKRERKVSFVRVLMTTFS